MRVLGSESQPNGGDGVGSMRAGPKPRETKFLPPEVIDEMVTKSNQYLYDILAITEELRRGESDQQRKDKLATVKELLLKERANFRLLSRQISPDIDYHFANTSSDVKKMTRDPFHGLAERLTPHLTEDLQGWSIVVGCPGGNLLHFSFVDCIKRIMGSPRRFSLSAVVTIFRHPSELENVYANVVYMEEADGKTQQMAKDERLRFGMDEISISIIPFLKSVEGKAAYYSSRSETYEDADAGNPKSSGGMTSEGKQPDKKGSSSKSAKAKKKMANEKAQSSTADCGEGTAQEEDDYGGGGGGGAEAEEGSPFPVIVKEEPRYYNIDSSIHGKTNGRERNSKNLSKGMIALEDTGLQNEGEGGEEGEELHVALKKAPPSAPVEGLGKRRRKSKYTKEFLQDALNDSDVEDEEEMEIKRRKAARKAKAGDDDFNLIAAWEQDADFVVDDADFHTAHLGNCRLCQVPLNYDQALEHMTLAHSDRPLEIQLCPVCGEEVASMTFHFRTYHCPGSSRCDICHKGYTKEERMLRHRKLVHFPDENDFVCDGPKGCGLRFLTEKEREAHLKKKAEGKLKKTKDTVCDLCGRGFPGPTALNVHLMTQHGFEKKIPCPQCGKKFAAVKHLHNHLVSHTQNRKYTCNVCGKTFARHNNLGQHMVSHRPPRHKCFICGKMFLYKSAGLNTHLKQVHHVDPKGIALPMVPDATDVVENVETTEITEYL